MITSTSNKGFQLTFENELTISVQFGRGNYCTNKNNDQDARLTECYSCNTAEIAIWDKDNSDYHFKNEGLAKGWINADEVAQWINKVQQAKDINSI